MRDPLGGSLHTRMLVATGAVTKLDEFGERSLIEPSSRSFWPGFITGALIAFCVTLYFAPWLVKVGCP